MNYKTFLLLLVLFVQTNDAFSQTILYRVSSTRGAVEVKEPDGTSTPLKSGMNLKDNQELVLSGYPLVFLMNRKTGKLIELRETGTYKVSEIESNGNQKTANNRSLENYENSELRTLKPFDRIDVSSNLKVELKYGSTEEVKILAAGLSTLDVKTEIRNNTLYLFYDGEDFEFDPDNFKGLKAIVTYKNISAIRASADSRIKSEETLVTSDTLKLSASSNARINLEVKTLHVTAKVSSKAEVELMGYSLSQNINCTSDSEYSAAFLYSESADVVSWSSGKIKLHIARRLEGKVGAVASVSYWYSGDPIVNVSTNSNGRLYKNGFSTSEKLKLYETEFLSRRESMLSSSNMNSSDPLAKKKNAFPNQKLSPTVGNDLSKEMSMHSYKGTSPSVKSGCSSFVNTRTNGWELVNKGCATTLWLPKTLLGGDKTGAYEFNMKFHLKAAKSDDKWPVQFFLGIDNSKGYCWLGINRKGQVEVSYKDAEGWKPILLKSSVEDGIDIAAYSTSTNPKGKENHIRFIQYADKSYYLKVNSNEWYSTNIVNEEYRTLPFFGEYNKVVTHSIDMELIDFRITTHEYR